MTRQHIIAALCLLLGPLCAAAGAGQLTVLKTFTRADGINPQGPLLLDNGVLYGTTTAWGNVSAGNDPSGNIFRMNVDGTGYQILSQFAHNPGYGPSGTLAFDGTTLYGTAQWIPPSFGSVIAVNTDGSNAHTVHGFDFDAGIPASGVVLDGTTLYGTIAYNGALFKVNTDGSGYQVLASIPGAYGGVTLIGDKFYGTATAGAYNKGMIFEINKDGSGFHDLHDFAGGAADGDNPGLVDLVTDGVSLFGTTQYGGALNMGTVFKIDLDGSNYEAIHSFTGADGTHPHAGLTLVGSTLYGTAGAHLSIFQINTDGTGFQQLYQADANDFSMFSPWGALTYGGPNVFYGTTFGLDQSHGGTIFMFTVPEPSSALLLGLGLTSLAAMHRTRCGKPTRRRRPRLLAALS